MKVLVYPADEYGCGHHRLIWPAEVLIHDGHDVEYIRQRDRRLRFHLNESNEVVHVELPEGVDVVVFQRVTDSRILSAITWLREHGIAVVIDIDDDLSSIHPSHVAFHELNPQRARHEVYQGIQAGMVKNAKQANAFLGVLSKRYTHSWRNLEDACNRATLVTTSTPGLIQRYASHGRGRVLFNMVPDHYLTITHEDSDVVGWPASLTSHPNDPPAIGTALARLVNDEGVKFKTIGDQRGGMRAAFGLHEEPEGADVTLEEWPHALSRLGVGIAPLADTLFNSRKSWLKPLEMSAVGVPWVVSPRAEYVRLHKMGAGILAEKPKEWLRTLRRLTNEPNARAELSLAGLDVAARLRLSDHAWRHLEAWSDAYELQHGRRVERQVIPLLG